MTVTFNSSGLPANYTFLVVYHKPYYHLKLPSPWLPFRIQLLQNSNSRCTRVQDWLHLKLVHSNPISVAYLRSAMNSAELALLAEMVSWFKVAVGSFNFTQVLKLEGFDHWILHSGKVSSADKSDRQQFKYFRWMIQSIGEKTISLAENCILF